jgi:hypothetical protein
MATKGPGLERDLLMLAGRWREFHVMQERSILAPAPTVDGKVGGAWQIHAPGARQVSARRETPGRAMRPGVSHAQQ